MACLERLWERGTVSICGNHDAGSISTIDLDRFNPIAAEACRWNGEQLTDAAREWLAALPQTLVEESFLMVHGSPKDPLWDYLLSYPQAIEAWERTEVSDVLVGHSHYQFVCEAGRGVERPGVDGLTVPLGHARLVVNPGSVGQPRDGDPRAAYAIFDDQARIISLRRAWYDISATQRAMAEAGLPEALIRRLSSGS
jgi:diadenosine tetraphosphatase ApaH/serine/threonine PP2A family protein phosphatase